MQSQLLLINMIITVFMYNIHVHVVQLEVHVPNVKICAQYFNAFIIGIIIVPWLRALTHLWVVFHFDSH